jgi:hypothetical protein
MKRLIVGIGLGTGIVVWVLILFILALSLLPKSNFRSEVFIFLRHTLVRFVNFFEGVTSTGTPDTPVVVRGGSVTAHGDMAWNQTPKNANAYVTKLTVNGNEVPANTLDFDGVDPASTTNPVHLPVETLSGNWIVTLDYRGGGSPGSEDQNTTLKICTKMDPSYQTCLPDNGPVNSTIFLLGGLDAQHQPVGTFIGSPQAVIDRAGGVFFDLNKCNGMAADTHAYCNHIYNVTVETSSGTAAPLHCVDGGCVIGIGNQ